MCQHVSVFTSEYGILLGQCTVRLGSCWDKAGGGGIDGEQISIMMSYSDVYTSQEQPSVSNHRERPEKGTVAWMIYRRWG